MIPRQTIAICREDQSAWEQRASFSPKHVHQLVKSGVKVIVQPSDHRIYPIETYLNAGAVEQEDISEANVIFSIKQISLDRLIPDKTYCMFSHTIKGQETNMAMLDAILEKRIRLIDYEGMTNSRGQRVVAFGRMAGIAGTVNILHGIGLRLVSLGFQTPFRHIGPAHVYRNVAQAKQAVKEVGQEIELGLMPQCIGPFIVVLTGSGNVSQGSQEMFRELPHEYVAPECLETVSKHGNSNKIYLSVISRQHYLQHIDGSEYNALEFQKEPEKYISTFSQKFAPYASVIINGIYWNKPNPRLLTIEDVKNLLPHGLLAISDISADPCGSIEFMTTCTTIDKPFCIYNPFLNKNSSNFNDPGILICSIANMPTQIPQDSTDFFGDLLYPFVENILESDAQKPLESHNFCSTIYKAIIASNGKLTPNYQYIEKLRKKSIFC